MSRDDPKTQPGCQKGNVNAHTGGLEHPMQEHIVTSGVRVDLIQLGNVLDRFLRIFDRIGIFAILVLEDQSAVQADQDVAKWFRYAIMTAGEVLR